MKLSQHLKKIIALLVSLWIVLWIIIIQIKRNYDSIIDGDCLRLDGILTYFIAWIAVLLIFRWFKTHSFNTRNISISEFKLVLLLFLIVFLPRYILISNFSVLQISDYEGYWEISQALFRGYPISAELKNYMATVAVNQLLISKIFSISYLIWGNNVFAPLMLNIFFTFLYTYLFYKICNNFVGQKLSFIGAICLAVWPENILNSVYMLSEPMFLVFLFSGILFYIKCKTAFTHYKWLFISLSGLFLGLSEQLRSITTIFIITFAILIICNIESKKKLMDDILQLVVMLVFYNLVKYGYLYYVKQLLGGMSTPTFGWPLYLGTDITNWGSWSEKAALTLTQVRNSNSVDNVQKEMLQKALINISSYDLKTIIRLVLEKMYILLGRGDGTYRDLQYIFVNSPEQILSGNIPAIIWSWGSLSNMIYLVLLNTFLLSTAFKSLLTDKLFFQLPFCGIMLLHCLIYISPRYQYPLLPLLLACSMISLNSINSTENKIFKFHLPGGNKCVIAK